MCAAMNGKPKMRRKHKNFHYAIIAPNLRSMRVNMNKDE